jgi:hypothetical protein
MIKRGQFRVSKSSPAGAAWEARMPSGAEFLPAFDAGGEILHCSCVLGGGLRLGGILFDAERAVDRLQGWSLAVMRGFGFDDEEHLLAGTGLPDVICVYTTKWQA